MESLGLLKILLIERDLSVSWITIILIGGKKRSIMRIRMIGDYRGMDLGM